MSKITITRALAELKTLESRYSKKRSQLKINAVSVGGKLVAPNNMYIVEDFEKQALADVQSLKDLYINICNIKTAIDKSNSVTEVEVMGKTMTIQEVLVYKKYIGLKEELLKELKRKYQDASTKVESEQNKLENYLEELHKSLGASDSKTKSQDFEAIDNAARKSREVKLVDPCEVTKWIEELEKEVEEFKTNVDYTLSTSNSTTFIEI